MWRNSHTTLVMKLMPLSKVPECGSGLCEPDQSIGGCAGRKVVQGMKVFSRDFNAQKRHWHDYRAGEE